MSESERLRVRQRDPEGLGRLSGEGPPAGIENRSGHHDRKVLAPFAQQVLQAEERRLTVERIEDGLHHQDVDPAVEETAGLLPVGLGPLEVGFSQPAAVQEKLADLVGLRPYAGRAFGAFQFRLPR